MIKVKYGCLAIVIMLLITISVVPQTKPDRILDSIAEDYVKLVLKVGLYNSDYVDYYYGPDEWKIADTSAAMEKYPLPVLAEDARYLIRQLGGVPSPEKQSARGRFLLKQLRAVGAFIEWLQGKAMSFDEESLALFDVVAPGCDYAYYDSLRDEMGRMLPGEGSIDVRLEKFLSRFVVPGDKVEVVFKTALDKTREITGQYLDLPQEEKLTVEFVTDKPWGGFCRYLGQYHSLVQINLDTPSKMHSLLYLASHEAYPGHHTNSALIENLLAEDSGWVEYTVCPIYVPWSVLAEGTASFAMDLVLPLSQLIQFAREVLFPLADLDSTDVELYFNVIEIRNKIWHIEMDIARDYLDGNINGSAAKNRLSKYLGLTDEEALQLIEFYDAYRSYIVTYYIGYDLVRDYVSVSAGDAEEPEALWSAFAELLKNPVMPSDLLGNLE